MKKKGAVYQFKYRRNFRRLKFPTLGSHADAEGRAQYEFTEGGKREREGLLAITRARGAGAFIIRASAPCAEACVLHHRCNTFYGSYGLTLRGPGTVNSAGLPRRGDDIICQNATRGGPSNPNIAESNKVPRLTK